MQVLNKNTQFFFNDEPNFLQKKIAKTLKILWVVAIFTKSINEQP